MCADVYLDFDKKHPGKLKESAFRALRPPELRRMSKRHLDMCGCRWCIEMRLFQDALNKARTELVCKHAPPQGESQWVPHCIAPYVHEKPSFAASDCASCDAKDAQGKSVGHAPLRYVMCMHAKIFSKHSDPNLLFATEYLDPSVCHPLAGAPSVSATSAASRR